MKPENILKQFSHGKLSYKQDLKYKRYTESIQGPRTTNHSTWDAN